MAWLFMDCGELQYGRRLPPKLKGAVCKSYARPAVLYGSEEWCLKESEIGIFANDRRIHVESNVWSAVQTQKKINRLDAHAEFEGNHRSVCHGKQCS